MGNYIYDIMIDTRNVDKSVTRVSEVDPLQLPGGDYPRGYNLLGILFNYRDTVSCTPLQADAYGMPNVSSPETIAYLENFQDYRSRYTVTRDALYKFDPNAMVENLRPNAAGPNLKPGEGVMVRVSDLLHRKDIAFVEYLLKQRGNFFHFMMG